MNNYLEKRNALPEQLKNFLMSDEPRRIVELICFMYGLEETKIQIISSPIALIFINEIKLKDYPVIIANNLKQSKEIVYGIAYEINKRIYVRFPDFFKDAQGLLEEWSRKKSFPLISEGEAWKKVLELEPWILEEEKEKMLKERRRVEELKNYQAQLEKLPINVALQKYSDLGEQLITQNRIKLAVFPDLVRPSIKNWLADYTYVVGISNRDPIARGNYLFKNENTRNLSIQDREKLALILKSFEEKIPLTINAKTKQVLFLTPEIKKETPQTTYFVKTANNFVSAEPKNFSDQTKQLPENIAKINNDRLSAWRRDLPPKEKLEQEPEILAPQNIRFSSPQTFSTEKNNKNVVAFGQKQALPAVQPKDNYPQIRPMPKNVVNLKEDN